MVTKVHRKPCHKVGKLYDNDNKNSELLRSLVRPALSTSLVIAFVPLSEPVNPHFTEEGTEAQTG